MNKTYLWWKFLCAMAVMNIAVWVVASWVHSDIEGFSPVQPVLSGIYVTVCAFRSFFLRIDLERYCLIDTPLSSIGLGRTCATIAEVCFSIQCALVIHDLGVLLGSQTIVLISYMIVPLIVIAQAFCWYATLTLNHYWHGVEEFAWVLMVALSAFCFAIGLNSLSGVHEILMYVGFASCVGSAYIMLFLDIPMYVTRRGEHSRMQIKYLTVAEGVRDAISRRIQTSDWNVWRKEAVWITTYFTFGVWLSIGMILVNFNT